MREANTAASEESINGTLAVIKHILFRGYVAGVARHGTIGEMQDMFFVMKHMAISEGLMKESNFSPSRDGGISFGG